MFPLADPVIDWATLGKVVAASLVVGIGVIGAYGLAVLGTTRSIEMRRSRRDAEAALYGVMGVVGAAICVGAIVGGIIVMSSK
jgi:hypothetical protein